MKDCQRVGFGILRVGVNLFFGLCKKLDFRRDLARQVVKASFCTDERDDTGDSKRR